VSEAPPSDNTIVTPLTGVRRWLSIAAGLLCLGLAYVGWVAPGIPVTPWVLLASYFFARSSPRLHRWLLRSPIFGKLLRDWHEHRGIRRPVKVFAVCLVVAVCGSSVAFAPVDEWLRWVIGCCGLIGICVILFVVPTIRTATPKQSP
jgi:uncharacterized membrane protein YbaN (DUF454 family)